MTVDVDVLVVGAGPTGLVLGSELCRRGVRVRVIDAHDAPLEWDRATVVHPRSLELLEGLGLLDRFLAVGVEQRAARLHSEGALLGEIDLAGSGSRFGFNLGISEQVTESILTDHLEAHGGEVERSCRLVGLVDRGEDLLATVDHAGTHEQLAARYVVGCDGLHSAVRRLSGIELVGHDITDPWAVFDLTMTGWAEPYEANYVYLDETPVILTALPGRRWRAYTRPRRDDADLVADSQAAVRRYHPDVAFDDVTGATRFRCHTKVTDRYREGRALVAGDAAHVCSPAEGHGMNSGMQDGFNLGWKLAAVCTGHADASLLDSYEAERRPVAERITASGDATEAAHALADPAERHRRNEVLRATLADPGGQHHEAVAEAELDIDYAASPIVLGDRLAGLWPGQRLSDTVPVTAVDGTEARLDQLVHPVDHTALVLAGPEAGAEAVAAAEVEVRAASDPSLIASVTVVARPHGLDLRWAQIDDEDLAALGVAGIVVVVVRPDGHLGLVARQHHAEAVAAYQRLVAPHPRGDARRPAPPTDTTDRGDQPWPH